jgi:MYXO-CTERM domain-containing protein
MRYATLVLVVLWASVADASPKPTATHKVAPEAIAAQTAGVLYFNRCRGGCTVREGTSNDVRTRTSTIPNNCPNGECTLTEFEHGDAVWNELMTCLREVYSPYNVMITDQQPAPGVAYNENIIAGGDVQIGVQAGGIAPVTGDCSPYSYAISFTFANDFGPDPLTLCYVAAQETGHAYGMGDHSWSFISDGRSACSDPMSYRVDCLSNGQRFFRNEAATCGEFNQKSCSCAGMNSHLKLVNALGAGQSIIPAPTLTVTQPAQGETLPATANVIATAASKRGVAKVELWLNGYKWGERKGVAFGQTNQPESAYSIPIPAEVPNSVLDVVVIAKDDIGVATTAPTVTVTKGAPCTSADSCLPGQLCEAGKCFWEPAAGEIGVECTYPQFCLSGMCVATSGGEMRCSQNCVPNVGDSCPMGFECLQTSATGGACWPESGDESGCCSSGSEGASRSALLALVMLLLLVVPRRRRTR